MRSSLRSIAGQTKAPPRPPVCTFIAIAVPATIAGSTGISAPPACAEI